MARHSLAFSCFAAGSLIAPDAAYSQDVHSANWERFSGNGPDFIFIDRQLFIA